MFDWLFGRSRPRSGGGQERPEGDPTRSVPDPAAPPTLGLLVEGMKGRGYQGPFANVCDGIMVTMFHGPAVSLEPAWIEPADNVFQMRVLDCEAFCKDSPMFAFGDGAEAVDTRLRHAGGDAADVCRRPIADAFAVPCLLSYPRGGDPAPDGGHFVAAAMEDLWNVFQFDGHLYFARSWTGQVRYRAKLLLRPGALFVTEVEASRIRPDDVYQVRQDDGLAVRQVDFLIKALLYRTAAPAPLPGCLSRSNPGNLALFALTEYGRWGWFPTFDDTTEYRLRLNGSKGPGRRCPEDALLPLIDAVGENDTSETRARLLDRLRGLGLYFAFSIPDRAVETRVVAADTPVQVRRHDWNGRPCAFAYTDPALRVEPSQGVVNIKGTGLWAFVTEKDPDAVLVINPGGPTLCVISPNELKALSR